MTRDICLLRKNSSTDWARIRGRGGGEREHRKQDGDAGCARHGVSLPVSVHGDSRFRSSSRKRGDTLPRRKCHSALGVTLPSRGGSTAAAKRRRSGWGERECRFAFTPPPLASLATPSRGGRAAEPPLFNRFILC